MSKPLKRKLGPAMTALLALSVLLFYVLENKDDLFSFKKQAVIPPEGNCTVTFLDVGQGDSTLISCGGTHVLIDAGESNRGADVVLALRRLGVRQLDYVIGTHAHSDHIGGLDTVINEIPTKRIILADLSDNVVPDTRSYIDLLEAMVNNSVELIPAQVGAQYSVGEATLTLLGPVRTDYSNLNDWSIVARLSFGKTAFLFTGDAEEKAESDLLDAGLDVSATVLKLGHHGSKSSSSMRFLKAVAPEYAVIEVGQNNKYGHPSAQTLENLMNLRITVYRTDLDGCITAVSDGKRVTFTVEKQKEAA